jgi:hypothetical protein
MGDGFVPEGQHDNSQPKCQATAERGPVPEGRLKSRSVPNGAKLRVVLDDFKPRTRVLRNCSCLRQKIRKLGKLSELLPRRGYTYSAREPPQGEAPRKCARRSVRENAPTR